MATFSYTAKSGHLPLDIHQFAFRCFITPVESVFGDKQPPGLEGGTYAFKELRFFPPGLY